MHILSTALTTIGASGTPQHFEGRRRLPFMLPVMYNLGVITTLLTILTTLMFKGLTIGVILLIHSFSKRKDDNNHHQPMPVHVHLHSDNSLMDWPTHQGHYSPSFPPYNYYKYKS